MAIPLPNPNINDFDTNDVQTWSSNKLKEGFEAVGGSVGSDGSVTPKQIKLLADVTTTEASDTYTVDITDATEVLAIINVNFDSTASASFNFNITSPEQSNAFTPGAYCSRSYTGGSEFKNTLYAHCKNGLAIGYGCVTTANGTGNLSMSNTNNYTNNIVCSKFSTVAIKCSESMPVGTKIKVYGY